MNVKTWFCICGFMLLLAIPCQAEIVVFGDSLSDTGNTYDATGESVPDSGLGYASGRFSNGPVWVEHLAAWLNEPLPTPSRTGGTNYAHGGSLVRYSQLLRPNLAEQVSNLSVASPTDLHIIWAGGNDMLNADLSTSKSDLNTYAKQTVAQINNNIDQLYAIGARRFLVLNLPALGETPLAKAVYSEEDLAKLNDLTNVFNVELAEELFKARIDNPESDIIGFDVYSLVNQAGAFGLTNLTDSATAFDANGNWLVPPGLATAPPEAGIDPDQYLFYDGMHPTAIVHEILGTLAALVVSQPNAPQVLTVDPSNDDVFSYDASGVLQDQRDLGTGNNGPKGMDADGFLRWVIDNDDYVYVYDKAGTKLGSWLAHGLDQPQGIAKVGDDLLIVDSGSDRVFVYEGTALLTSGEMNPTSSWNLNTGKGNTNPRGITSNGVNVWVVNTAVTDRVYKYNLDGTYRGRWNLADSNPGGISLGGDGSTIWIVDVANGLLNRYDNAASRNNSNTVIPANASFPLDAANTNPQGVAAVNAP